jgi:hypothetical protein
MSATLRLIFKDKGTASDALQISFLKFSWLIDLKVDGNEKRGGSGRTY